MSKRREREFDPLRNPADVVRFLIMSRVDTYTGERLEVRPAVELALDSIFPPVLDFVEADFTEAHRNFGDDIVVTSVREPWNDDPISAFRFRMLALRDHVSKLADGTVPH